MRFISLFVSFLSAHHCNCLSERLDEQLRRNRERVAERRDSFRAAIGIQTIYRELELEPIEEWAEGVYGKDEIGEWVEDWVFQQDGATSHTAKVNRNCLAEHFPDFIDKHEWPPKSPDLTVPDYYGWGRLKELVNVEAFNSVEELWRALQEAWDGLDQEEINLAVDDFSFRLEEMIAANGGHFE